MSFVALTLGGLCVAAVLFNFLVRSRFEFRDIAIMFFGFMLIGLPVFQTIDFTISADSIKGKFEQSVGAAKAETNAELEKIRKDLSTANEKIEALAQQSPAISNEIKEIEIKNEPSSDFISNGRYTILVFYREPQAEKATRIVEALLKKGFKSSGIVTDLSEAKQKYDPGTAWIVWEADMKSLAEQLKGIIQEISPESIVKIRDTSYDLNRGDVQILLF